MAHRPLVCLFNWNGAGGGGGRSAGEEGRGSVSKQISFPSCSFLQTESVTHRMTMF